LQHLLDLVGGLACVFEIILANREFAQEIRLPAPPSPPCWTESLSRRCSLPGQFNQQGAVNVSLADNAHKPAVSVQDRKRP
jgi:hypothetical protein